MSILSLQCGVQVTPIKFTSGELLREESIWIANDNTPASTRPRKLLPIILPDIPTRLTGHNKVEEYAGFCGKLMDSGVSVLTRFGRKHY